MTSTGDIGRRPRPLPSKSTTTRTTRECTNSPPSIGCVLTLTLALHYGVGKTRYCPHTTRSRQDAEIKRTATVANVASVNRAVVPTGVGSPKVGLRRPNQHAATENSNGGAFAWLCLKLTTKHVALPSKLPSHSSVSWSTIPSPHTGSEAKLRQGKARLVAVAQSETPAQLTKHVSWSCDEEQRDHKHLVPAAQTHFHVIFAIEKGRRCLVVARGQRHHRPPKRSFARSKKHGMGS